VPVAEPSGEFETKCSIDLSPVYGTIEETKTVTITQPPADILDKRLAELESEDAGVRSMAASDLAFFEGEGERVFPALVTCLGDGSEGVRTSALYSLYSYPEQIAANHGVFLKMVRDTELEGRFRERAAFYLGRFGPAGDREILKVLEEALKSQKENPEGQFSMYAYAIQEYKRRMKTEAEN
jgi:HEAT repeat protein